MLRQDFDIAGFLRDYWQKKPLLIRNAWVDWINPLHPDEMAGLSCEDDIESRLVIGAHSRWALEHGPFPEDRVGQLGAQPWTLLVQGVDRFVPEVAALKEPFRFIPDWRIDDVMVSYAADRGGVGPHFDRYDVFLVQGLGRRRWRIGAMCDDTTPLLPHDGLRLLAHFEASEEWVLEPGDMLYLPPGVAHDGVALGDDCMTYSIGFRAPSARDLVSGWCDHLAECLPESHRYTDPDLAPQDNPGEISPDAIARLHAMATAAMGERDGFARWFGQYVTAPTDADADCRPDEAITIAQLREHLASDCALWRNTASRFSFIRQGEGVQLFADGECFECAADTAPFARQLCVDEQVDIEPDSAEPVLALAVALYNQGSVVFEDEDED